jgi:hypothetical protein
MTKIAAGVLTLLLMTAGLVAATTASAEAACSSYGGCVNTRTVASGPKVVTKRKRATVCGTVTAVASNAKPRGDLRISVVRNRGKFAISRTLVYSGGKMCVTTRKLKKTGNYTVTATFIPGKKSAFNPSTGAYGFRVAR